jgi:hypothetical protein
MSSGLPFNLIKLLDTIPNSDSYEGFFLFPNLVYSAVVSWNQLSHSSRKKDLKGLLTLKAEGN